MGTPHIATQILSGLLKNGFNVVGVVSQPDAPVGRKKILTPSPVKKMALDNNLLVLTPNSIKDEYQKVLDLKPDLIITCAYGQFIPSIILDTPIFGCINVHGSLLPKYRGGAPIQWAIINGEKETGITIVRMVKKMDAGPIIFKKSINISDDDTNSSLFIKLGELGKEALLEVLNNYENYDEIPQNEDEATFAYNLNKEDEYIDFNNDYMKVYNHIRGLLDNPGAYSIIENKKYKFHKVRYLNEVKGKPNEIIGLIDNAIGIGSINGTILIDEIQPEGKNVMMAKDFYNGQGRNLVGKYFDRSK